MSSLWQKLLWGEPFNLLEHSREVGLIGKVKPMGYVQVLARHKNPSGIHLRIWLEGLAIHEINLALHRQGNCLSWETLIGWRAKIQKGTGF